MFFVKVTILNIFDLDDLVTPSEVSNYSKAFLRNITEEQLAYHNSAAQTHVFMIKKSVRNHD